MRFALELDALGIVNEAVKNGVCQGGVGDAQVPICYWHLAGNQVGGVSKTVIKNFENILGILNSNGVPHPVIQNQQVGFHEGPINQ